MERMKGDMGGAAAVLGATRALALLDVPLHLICLVPATENMPGGRATKPGDVVKALNGLTIEIINTDAEGRLILADALAYAERFHPDAIFDAATLTGACVVALGNHAAGVMGDERLIARLREAGERSGERVWPLPLFEEYGEQIKSDVADVKNVGGRPAGRDHGGLLPQQVRAEGRPLGPRGHRRPLPPRPERPYQPKGGHRLRGAPLRRGASRGKEAADAGGRPDGWLSSVEVEGEVIGRIGPGLGRPPRGLAHAGE